MTALDGLFWFDAGVAAWCAFLALRWALDRLRGWHADRQWRREMQQWRRLRGNGVQHG